MADFTTPQINLFRVAVGNTSALNTADSNRFGSVFNNGIQQF